MCVCVSCVCVHTVCMCVCARTVCMCVCMCVCVHVCVHAQCVCVCVLVYKMEVGNEFFCDNFHATIVMCFIKLKLFTTTICNFCLMTEVQ